MRYIPFCFILLLSSAITIAQTTCSPLEEALLSIIEDCSESALGTACLASDSVMTISDDELPATEPIPLISLDSISTLNEDGGDALLTLNRDNIALRVIAIGATTVQNTAPRTMINVYTLRGVNVRQNPSLDASVIASLPQGNDFTAVGRLADNTWIQVQLDDGRIGWASAQYFVTQDGFANLQTVTPTTPPYLPMQAITLETDDCGTVFISAFQPSTEDEAQIVPIIFGVNGAQITVDGMLALTTDDNLLTITSIIGEHTVNAFGFEMPISETQQTSIPLSDTLSIAGIPSDAVDADLVFASDVLDVVIENLRR